MPRKKKQSQALVKQESAFVADSAANSQVQVPKFATVDEFAADFTRVNQKIQECSKNYYEKLLETLKLLCYMETLLSKQGVNHAIVAAAKKKYPNRNIPWWTDYKKIYLAQLGMADRTLRTHMQRFRGELPAPKPKSPTPLLNATGRSSLIKAYAVGTDMEKAVLAGRDAKPFAEEFKKLRIGKRMDDVVTAAEVVPDFERGFKSLLDGFEKLDSFHTLPIEFRKLVRDARKKYFPETAAKIVRENAAKKAAKQTPIVLPPESAKIDVPPLPKKEDAPPIKAKADNGGKHTFKPLEVQVGGGENYWTVIVDDTNDLRLKLPTFDAAIAYEPSEKEIAKAVTA